MRKWYEKSGPESDTVLCTCVQLSRNLREFPFPVRMNRRDRAGVTERILRAAADPQVGEAFRFRYFDLEKLSRTEAVSLVERQLATPEFIAEPEGRGLLVSEDEAVSMLINGKNHLQLQVVTEGMDPDRAYRTADLLDTMLDRPLQFAFDERLGYLSENLANLGTGLCASLLLHLPALQESGGAARLSANLPKLGLLLREAGGAGIGHKGAVYQLTNPMSLGLSEQEALSNLRSIAVQILAQERAARQELAGSIEVEDTVFRSLGILQNAKVLGGDEFMELISNVRFGVVSGMIPEIGCEEIDRLIIEVQPATLLSSESRKLTVNERHALRAQIVRNALNHKKDRVSENENTESAE